MASQKTLHNFFINTENTSNICTVHEIDEIEGRPFIAMAFLEGRTLAQKIAAAPLDLDEALGRWEPYPPYDVSPDGQRFMLAETLGDPEAPEPSIHVVENWFAEFHRGGGAITPELLVNRGPAKVAG